MKKQVIGTAIAVCLAVVSQSRAAILTQWNFNFGNDAAFATGTLSPSIGAGTAIPVGGITHSFASGDATGGSTDPNVGDDSGWQTTTYTAQGVGSGTRGVEFQVSTLGATNIMVSWDCRQSNTSSKFTQFQYWDGSSFVTTGLVNNGVFDADQGGDFWYNGRTVDLSSISAVENNANFKFRIVTVFAPSTSSYTASTDGSSYAASGTLRYDMVTVTTPEPATVGLLALGGLALVARRRRK